MSVRALTAKVKAGERREELTASDFVIKLLAPVCKAADTDIAGVSFVRRGDREEIELEYKYKASSSYDRRALEPDQWTAGCVRADITGATMTEIMTRAAELIAQNKKKGRKRK